ncbi:hypothetical protein WMF37_05685 [Sorangium sp. So ce291]|uniref:hypothetical protein n=1 Tax=Sorangium sp. So ce291 TaxID=3133294 RepID=UPI003F61A84D
MLRFCDAFNRENLDEAMAYFHENAVYVTLDGKRCQGPAYWIATGMAKRIGLGPAKWIGVGSAKWIAAGSAKWIAAETAEAPDLGRQTAVRHVHPSPMRPGMAPGFEEAGMSARRTEMHRLQELVRLHRRGEDCREVARLLGMGPNTERRYRTALSQAGLLEGRAEEIPALEELKEAVRKHVPPKVAPQQQSSVEPWRAYIAARVEEGLKPAATYDRLRLEERDFSGSRSAVKRMVAALQREQGVRPQDVAIAVETEAGHVAREEV